MGTDGVGRSSSDDLVLQLLAQQQRMDDALHGGRGDGTDGWGVEHFGGGENDNHKEDGEDNTEDGGDDVGDGDKDDGGDDCGDHGLKGHCQGGGRVRAFLVLQRRIFRSQALSPSLVSSLTPYHHL